MKNIKCPDCGKEWEGEFPQVCDKCACPSSLFIVSEVPGTKTYMTKYYQCPNCGDVYEENAVPSLCNKCGSHKDVFRLMEETELVGKQRNAFIEKHAERKIPIRNIIIFALACIVIVAIIVPTVRKNKTETLTKQLVYAYNTDNDDLITSARDAVEDYGISKFSSDQKEKINVAIDSYNYREKQKEQSRIEEEQRRQREQARRDKWIYGKWKCNTPYGTIFMYFDENGSMMTSIDYEWHEFEIDEERIWEHCGGYGSSYDLDRQNHRISCGNGYWAFKCN